MPYSHNSCADGARNCIQCIVAREARKPNSFVIFLLFVGRLCIFGWLFYCVRPLDLWNYANWNVHAWMRLSPEMMPSGGVPSFGRTKHSAVEGLNQTFVPIESAVEDYYLWNKQGEQSTHDRTIFSIENFFSTNNAHSSLDKIYRRLAVARNLIDCGRW